jgi:hypothetical protein
VAAELMQGESLAALNLQTVIEQLAARLRAVAEPLQVEPQKARPH